MKLWAIIGKDIGHAVRNTFFLVFGLGIPLLTVVVFYFAFGGVQADDGGIDVPRSRVVVVNLDPATPLYEGFSASTLLVEFLRSGDLAGLLEVVEGTDAAAARGAVDRQEAAAALILPEGLTGAIVELEGRATVELYRDPTLTIGPAIVQGVVRQFVDSFSGAKIAGEVAAAQLAAHGQPVDETVLRRQVLIAYGQWARSLGEGAGEEGSPLLQVRAPASSGPEETLVVRIASRAMAGIMVMYAFFTAAANAQGLLQEDEEGTLPRLLTTPTAPATILAAKFVATVAVVALQVTALLLFSHLVFRIDWGPLPQVALVSAGLVVMASGCGVLVNSLLKSTRQSGIVFGGVMTVTGLVGMLGTFTSGVPGASRAVETATLVVPQGWAVRAYNLLLAGGGPAELLPILALMVGVGAAAMAAGAWRFGRRLA